MALNKLVKLSHVTHLSDARYGAGMGVSLMGFPLDIHAADFVSPEKFAAITEWLAGVEFVGEFENATLLEIEETLRNYKLDYLQVSNLKMLPFLQELRLPIIAKMNIERQEPIYMPLSSYKDNLKYLLLESSKDEKTPLSDKEIQMIQKIAENFPVLLGYGITKENVSEILTQIPLQGIALKGSEEIKAGYKDFDDLAEILEQIEIDD
jgi:phosphoribosylanthranilate isomerase